MIRRLRFTLVLVPALAGCASTSAREPFAEVAHAVEARTGQHLHWSEGTDDDRAVEAEVRELLGHPLTVDGAVQIALLDNRELQATYEELGVAQADLVQAGLLRNPSFGAAVLFPSASGRLISTDFSVAQDFLDLFVLPLRKRVARAQLQAAELRVEAQVFTTAAQVKEAYFRLQAAQQLVTLRQTVADAEAASAELNRRQYEAGNIGELQHVTEQALDQQARLDLLRSQQDRLEAQEQLTRLLGVAEAPASWTLSGELADPKEEAPPLEQLESLSATQRLDLDLARRQTEALKEALSLTQTTRWFGTLEFGASTERDPEGARVTGPDLRIEIPLFDRREAAIARLEALLRAQQARQANVELAVHSEIRATRSRMLAAQSVAERYRTVLLPLRAQAMALSQQHYNAMLLGVYGLLQAKQSEVNARREYVEAVRDYWIARAELEHAVGGRLPASTRLSLLAPVSP